MLSHHKESLDKFLNIYTKDPEILAIILAGSIAHGSAKPTSDIDIITVYSEKEFLKRQAEKKVAFSLWDICTYEGGYIDVKGVSVNFLKTLAEKGSDPARYAFKDSIIVYSKTEGIELILQEITRFPVNEKESRRKRFASQVLAFKWYYSMAEEKQNKYLHHLAVQKLALFCCRLILNENNMLYPYHKWLLNETGKAELKPANFDAKIMTLLENPTLDFVNSFALEVLQFLNLDEKTLDWPNQFLVDSEQNWLNHEPPVDDL